MINMYNYFYVFHLKPSQAVNHRIHLVGKDCQIIKSSNYLYKVSVSFYFCVILSHSSLLCPVSHTDQFFLLLPPEPLHSCARDRLSMLNGRCAQQPTALSGMAHTDWHCKMSVSFVPHSKRRDEKILAEPSGQEDWLLSLLLVIKLPFPTTFPLANPKTADL